MFKNTLIFLAVFFAGCDASTMDGQGLLDAIVWAGNHPALMVVAVTLLTPLIAMIPVVGAPVAAVWAKIGTSIIPALKAVAEAVEADTKKRTIAEAAAVVVGRLADDPKNPVGQIPGVKAVAEAGARGLIARIRARRAK
jgi:hypothetical protein